VLAQTGTTQTGTTQTGTTQTGTTQTGTTQTAADPRGEGRPDQQSGAPGEQPASKPAPLPWRGTKLVWAQSLTTETVGIGQPVQSSNPTYDTVYSLRPRYYLYGDGVQVVSARGEIGMGRELTNSDTTTERGEWSLTDARLYGAYARLLHQAGPLGPAPLLPDDVRATKAPDVMTAVALQAPLLTFPTSTVSRNNGTLLGLGVLGAVAQTLPVLGVNSDLLPTLALQLAVAYQHTFTDSTEPTSGGLGRVRMDPDGVSVPSDQLGGAAFAAHQLTLIFAGSLFLTRSLSWSANFGWRPSWKYQFEREQELCGVVATGCITIDTVEDARTYAVVSEFGTEFGWRALDQLGVSFGYTNATLQLAPDGTRRNVFYSPDARFQLVVTMHLDELYSTVTHRRRAPRRTHVARSTGPHVAHRSSLR
jgi:hypothetical protein